MRPVDIETSGETWAYTPSQHKAAHHGHARVIYLPPRAQAIVRPFLSGRAVDAYLFSAAEAEQERLARLHAQRKTSLGCGNTVGSNRRAPSTRHPGSRYQVAAYRRAIARVCERADAEAHRRNTDTPADQILLPSWHPH